MDLNVENQFFGADELIPVEANDSGPSDTLIRFLKSYLTMTH